MIILTQDDSGALRLASGGAARTVLTAAQAARRLRRSLRQVYRLMKGGRLGRPQKLLGEWLIDRDMVENLRKEPLEAAPIPSGLCRLFQDFPPKSLNAGRDRVLIMTRVLSEGLPEEKGWLLRRYGAAGLRRYLGNEGKRALAPELYRHWKENLAPRAGRDSRRRPPSPGALPEAGTSS